MIVVFATVAHRRQGCLKVRSEAVSFDKSLSSLDRTIRYSCEQYFLQQDLMCFSEISS